MAVEGYLGYLRVGWGSGFRDGRGEVMVLAPVPGGKGGRVGPLSDGCGGDGGGVVGLVVKVRVGRGRERERGGVDCHVGVGSF